MATSLKVEVHVKSGGAISATVFEMLQKLQGEFDFELSSVDKPGEDGKELPIVLINGKHAFRGQVSEGAFRKRLRKSQVKSLDKSSGQELEAMEQWAPPPFIPAPMATLLLLIVSMAGAGFFAWQGFQQVGYGQGQLASTLLDVQPRNERPLDFRLPSMTGGEVSLDQFKDKVVFLNFWATWCPPCLEEMPSMKRLGQKLAGRNDIVMLAVSVDENWDVVRNYFKDKNPPFTVLLDQSATISKQYGTSKFPETYIIVDGQLAGHIIGPRDWDRWYAEGYLEATVDQRLALMER